MITINIGRPKVSLSKSTDTGGETGETSESLFNTRNLIILAAGISIGIILKQQSDIVTLKRTVEYLQEVIR